MQIKVKGQISIVLYLINHWSNSAQILYVYGVWLDDQITYKHQIDMRPSWLCKWRSKVKSSFVLYLRNLGSNRIQIFTVYLPWLKMNTVTFLIWSLNHQRSNFPCFISQEPLGPLSSNFVCIWSVTRQAYYIIRSSWYEAILAMQIKVKGQISPVLYLRNHWSHWAQICYAYGVWPDKHIA